MIRALCEKLEFPKEAILSFEAAYKTLIENEEAEKLIRKAHNEVFYGDKDKIYSYRPFVEEAAKILNINFYTLNMVFWLICADKMREIYKEKGFPEEKYYESLKDLKYKLVECKKRYNIWGTYSCWFRGFFRGERLAFGRLQFDITAWPMEDYKSFVKKGELGFKVHIPSSGPLLPSLVWDSFKELYEFFKDRLNGKPIVIFCFSWLLYSPMIKICDEESNMRKFFDVYDIVEDFKTDAFSQLYTIFGVEEENFTSFEDLPEDTGLRKRIKKYLIEGGTFGSSKGILIYDGQNKLN